MKKFHLTDQYALINFDSSSFANEIELIKSKSFEEILSKFYTHHIKINDDMHFFNDYKLILNIYKLLLVYDLDTVFSMLQLQSKSIFLELYHFTEKFYDYWRKLERYGLMQVNKSINIDSRKNDLLVQSDLLNSKILSLYRMITQKLLGTTFSVYRQLPAGVNASLLYMNHKYSSSEDYAKLQNVGFVTSIITRPPFIVYSKNNTRKGTFYETKQNPLNHININKLHYLAFPIKVGKLLAFVYIHRDFLHHGVGLSNLFELTKFDEFDNRKPDLTYVYGMKEKEYDGTYYYDQQENMYLGFVSRDDENDYFGYLKKMILTLHNLYMIDHGNLPIHGAMVSVKLKNDKTKNIVIIGDSGAGKSETLEALRIIGNTYIKDMKVVFDDMGVFHIDQKVVATGTEIGAFVRLDDLEAGYAYQEMDRAIFLNPNQKNARVIIPISLYDFISSNHQIDILLYANNYESNSQGIKIFETTREAIDVFKKGERFAKGTTSETGLVRSYFANPFGPYQKQEQCDVLIDKYFNLLEQQHILIGEIYTNLAVKGHESEGPQEAAKILLEYISIGD
ncbi:MAG: hypothetical protein RBQ97_06185 [Acholeplasma sp.]|nr:hypothetical protein [Acholeplasma sp.]